MKRRMTIIAFFLALGFFGYKYMTSSNGRRASVSVSEGKKKKKQQ